MNINQWLKALTSTQSVVDTLHHIIIITVFLIFAFLLFLLYLTVMCFIYLSYGLFLIYDFLKTCLDKDNDEQRK